MTDNFRKLTKEEFFSLLQRFGVKDLKPNADIDKTNYFKKYYPKNAASALISYNSEYNDQYYTGKVQYVAVYDKDGNELLPLKGKEREARDLWSNLFDVGGEHYNEIEDKVIYISDIELPDLYVKE